jgi:hypothetical protein
MMNEGYRKTSENIPEHGNCNRLFFKAHDNSSRRLAPWSGIKTLYYTKVLKHSYAWVHK